MSLGQTHFVPGTNPVCPGDIPGVSQEQPDQKVYVYVPFSCLIIMGCRERVLRFMGRRVQRRHKFRMHAVKWVAAKLKGDKTASFCGNMSGLEVAG